MQLGRGCPEVVQPLLCSTSATITGIQLGSGMLWGRQALLFSTPVAITGMLLGNSGAAKRLPWRLCHDHGHATRQWYALESSSILPSSSATIIGMQLCSRMLWSRRALPF